MPTYIKNVKFAAREQAFRITLTGLLPLTFHWLYLEGQLVSNSKVKPVGGTIGSTIKTDASGTARFDYYYDTGLPLATTPFEEAQNLQTLVAGDKQIVIANKSITTLDSNYRETYFSYAISSIKVEVVY